LPLQSAKVTRSGLGTQRPDLVVEQWWRKESSAKEEKGSWYGSVPIEVTRGRASGGKIGGASDSATTDLATSTKSPEREEKEEAVAAVVCC
jgi:hypothetical protein